MRQFLLILALMLPASSALAQQAPTFLQGIHNCVQLSVGYTAFAQLAADSKDSDHDAFVAYIQQVANLNANPAAREMVIYLGKLAWASRGMSVNDTAMQVYDKCYSKLGTKV